MKTNLFVKLAGGIFLIATVVVIGCSKKASTSSLSEEVISGKSTNGGNPNAHFKECPSTSINSVYYPGNTQWHFTGTIAGCGNPAELQITADITVSPVCKSPGGQISPGQSKTFTVSSFSRTYYPDNNGNITFDELTPEIPISALDPKICAKNWELTIASSTMANWVIKLDNNIISRKVGNSYCQ